MAKTLVRTAAALLVGVGLWSCNAPFIPVPPAMAPSFEAITVSDGMGGTKKLWEAHGAPYEWAANARFFVYNAKLKTGVIATAASDGSYVAPPLEGTQGDNIQVSYETARGEVSPSICKKLQEGILTDDCD